jgi:hypothetical protein
MVRRPGLVRALLNAQQRRRTPHRTAVNRRSASRERSLHARAVQQRPSAHNDNPPADKRPEHNGVIGAARPWGDGPPDSAQAELYTLNTWAHRPSPSNTASGGRRARQEADGLPERGRGPPRSKPRRRAIRAGLSRAAGKRDRNRASAFASAGPPARRCRIRGSARRLNVSELARQPAGEQVDRDIAVECARRSRRAAGRTEAAPALPAPPRATRSADVARVRRAGPADAAYAGDGDSSRPGETTRRGCRRGIVQSRRPKCCTTVTPFRWSPGRGASCCDQTAP